MKAALFVGLLLCFAVPALAQPQPLTISEALSQCYERNPELRAAVAETRQSRSSYHLAGSLPTGSFIGGATRGWGPAALSSFSALPRDEYLQFQQPFMPFGAYQKGRLVAWLGWKQAEARLLFTKIQLMRQTKDAFYQVLAAQQNLKVLASNLELARQIFESSEKEFQAKKAGRLVILASRVQLNQVRQGLVQGQGELGAARAELASLIGLPRGDQIVVQGTLDTDYAYLQLADLLKQGESSPALIAAERGTQAGHEQVRLASLQGNPSPSLVALYDFRLPSYIVGAQLSVPFDWGQLGYEVQSKERAAQALDQRYRAVQLEVTAKIQKAYAEFQAGATNSANYQQAVLLPQEEAVQLIQQDYKLHRLDYDVVLLAQQQLEEIRLENIRQQLIERLALNALEEAVGAPLEILSPAPREPDLTPEPDLPEP
ncbi:TolC family protein [bacterium]|nr:TolC family protein [bacterium]